MITKIVIVHYFIVGEIVGKGVAYAEKQS